MRLPHVWCSSCRHNIIASRPDAGQLNDALNSGSHKCQGKALTSVVMLNISPCLPLCLPQLGGPLGMPSCLSQGILLPFHTQILALSRAEATDVANAVLDGADGLLLGAETLRGKYPAITIKTVLAICRQAEEVFDYSGHFECLTLQQEEVSFSTALVMPHDVMMSHQLRMTQYNTQCTSLLPFPATVITDFASKLSSTGYADVWLDDYICHACCPRAGSRA